MSNKYYLSKCLCGFGLAVLLITLLNPKGTFPDPISDFINSVDLKVKQ
jgi:hypothetical protein